MKGTRHELQNQKSDCKQNNCSDPLACLFLMLVAPVALIATNVEYGFGTVEEIVIRLMAEVHRFDVA